MNFIVIINDRDLGGGVDPKQQVLQTLDKNLGELRDLSNKGEFGAHNKVRDEIRIKLNFCVETGLFSKDELAEHVKRLSESSPTSEWYPFGS